jgi:hypothetical protein
MQKYQRTALFGYRSIWPLGRPDPYGVKLDALTLKGVSDMAACSINGEWIYVFNGKALACGSIPFAESPSWVQSVYVTDHVLEAIKTGKCIIDKRVYGGNSLEFLRRLPGDRVIDAFYGTINPAGDGPGLILDARSQPIGKWSRVVAGIAFGGLVPQADTNVIDVVRSTVAGAEIQECIQNLEGLIDTLHCESRELDLFGQTVRSRCGNLGHSFVNYTFPSTDSNPRDAAAVFARYMNLLERLVAIPQRVPPPPSGKAAVSSISMKAGSQAGPLSGRRQSSDDVFEAAVAIIEMVYKASLKPATMRESDEHNLLGENLGVTVKAVSDQLHTAGNMSLEDKGKIVRCILAAWAATVPSISVQEHKSRSAHAQSELPQDGSCIIMEDMPPIVAFG